MLAWKLLKTNSSDQCSHIISFCSHPSPATSASLGFSNSLVDILADLLVAFSFRYADSNCCTMKMNQGKRFQMFHGAEKKDLYANCYIKGEPWSGSSLPPPLLWSSPQTVREIYWEHSHCDIWKLEYALQCHHKEHKKSRCAVLSSPSETKTLTFHFSIICHLLTYPHPLTKLHHLRFKWQHRPGSGRTSKALRPWKLEVASSPLNGLADGYGKDIRRFRRW